MAEEGIERLRAVGILVWGKVGEPPSDFLVMLVFLLPAHSGWPWGKVCPQAFQWNMENNT